MDCAKFIELSKKWQGDTCIFGAGECGNNLGYELAKEAGFHIAFYCDNRCAGEKRHGYNVYPAEFLNDKLDSVLCIVAVYGKNGDDIVKQLKDMRVKHIFRLAEGDVEWELAQFLDETGDKELINRFPYIMDDEIYLKRRFKLRTGKNLDLEHPRTFNEKLQWLKIHDRKAEYTVMADKYAVKEYVASRIGWNHIVPSLGVWDSFDEIDFDSLPMSFVLKCTHDSGSIVICKNKNQFDIKAAREKLEKARRRNYFWPDREWVYKDIPRRIIAEKYIESSSNMLEVYKIFNFSGHPKLIQVIQNDKTEYETIDYYDTDWNICNIRQNFPNSLNHLERPEQLEEMLMIAETLSKGCASVRTDFYINDGIVLFSEYTFYSDSGCECFHPDEWDRKLGDLILLD